MSDNLELELAGKYCHAPVLNHDDDSWTWFAADPGSLLAGFIIPFPHFPIPSIRNPQSATRNPSSSPSVARGDEDDGFMERLGLIRIESRWLGTTTVVGEVSEKRGKIGNGFLGDWVVRGLTALMMH